MIGWLGVILALIGAARNIGHFLDSLGQSNEAIWLSIICAACGLACGTLLIIGE